jgi:hypothetical protein
MKLSEAIKIAEKVKAERPFIVQPEKIGDALIKLLEREKTLTNTVKIHKKYIEILRKKAK